MSQSPDADPTPAAAGENLDEQQMDELVQLAQSCLELARTGESATLAAYVDAGVPVDLTDASGNTVLMLAAYHGHADTVAALAERGADVDRVNDRGQSPLAGAVFKAEAAVAAVLLEHGADPDVGTPTARETAAVFGQEALLEGGPRG